MEQLKVHSDAVAHRTKPADGMAASTGLIAGSILLFGLGYYLFMRRRFVRDKLEAIEKNSGIPYVMSASIRGSEVYHHMISPSYVFISYCGQFQFITS